MTPAELGAALAGLLGEVAGWSESFGAVTVDVPRAQWVAAATHARDVAAIGCRYFDWLAGVDELDAGFAVVCHLWSVEYRHGLLLRTVAPREDPTVPSLTAVFPGASWPEREAYEMFGIVFTGHPHLVPLLLPEGFEGHPLRKDFVLAARVAKEWPGAREPGESHTGGPARKRMRPPGVPDPDEWGPDANRHQDSDEEST